VLREASGAPAGRCLCHLVSNVLQVILLALERGCTRRDDIVDFVNQRSRSIKPCGRRPAQRLRPTRPQALIRPASASSSAGRPPASASLGQSVPWAAPAGPTGPAFGMGLKTKCDEAASRPSATRPP